MWMPWDKPGLEHLHLTIQPEGAVAEGLIIGIAEGQPFHARYEVSCDTQWRVRNVSVALLGSNHPGIRVAVDGKGHWMDDSGERIPELAGCVDVDVSVTPFTNTLPIRRLRLQPGASAELLVAYIDVPALRLTAVRQRYTCLDARPDKALYRFEMLDGGFTAELPVDTDGLVIHYPGLFRRVWSN